MAPVPVGRAFTSATLVTTGPSDKRITIHRVPEPSTEDSVVVKETFHATYPDGAHDAETLLVAPDGGLFIVTKGETDAVGLVPIPSRTATWRNPPARTCGQPPRIDESRPSLIGSPMVPSPLMEHGSCCGPGRGSQFHRATQFCSRAIGWKRGVFI